MGESFKVTFFSVLIVVDIIRLYIFIKIIGTEL